MDHHSTFLRRLLRNKRGNTIAIMAAAMVPLMGFTGSAVDMARLYVVKVRLQQACDAGVLAGRKAMTDTSTGNSGSANGGLDSTATAQANSFFNNNFPTGWYQTTNVSFTPRKAIDGTDSTVANAVSGTASATVPMAVMNFFGVSDRNLTVTCQARYDLADTDIMFVLDTTGSMSCVPSAAASCANGVVSYTRADGTTGYYNQESSGSKIQGVRDAVVLFDDTMRANADATTHFRYGFVTYSSAVNVGSIIPSQYLQNTTWTYQSRQLSPVVNATSNTAGDYNYGAPSSVTFTGIPQSYCVAQRLPATGFARQGPPAGSTAAWADAGYYQARWYSGLSWTSTNGGTCTGQQQALRPLWRYEPIAQNIANFTAGQTVTVPGRLDGLTSKWRGCIEEVDTSNTGTFDVNALPNDLDPDFKPSVATNKWRPIWPEVEWLRGAYGAVDRKDDEVDENAINQYEDYTFRAGSTLDRSGAAACGMPAQRLKVWTASQVQNYVNNVDFKPFGGTYHDVGMIWGTRMLSPDGIFGADTDPWAGRNEPSRSIVFMTDGNMAPSATSYGQYGVETWDQRTSPQGSDIATDTARHNARFRVECDAAKKKGITIYVVALGIGINNDLTYCASPGQTFEATSTQTLKDAFRSIAQRVAMLRVTQ